MGLTPVTPGVGRLRQEECCEFRASLGYIVGLQKQVIVVMMYGGRGK